MTNAQADWKKEFVPCKSICGQTEVFIAKCQCCIFEHYIVWSRLHLTPNRKKHTANKNRTELICTEQGKYCYCKKKITQMCSECFHASTQIYCVCHAKWNTTCWEICMTNKHGDSAALCKTLNGIEGWRAFILYQQTVHRWKDCLM